MDVEFEKKWKSLLEKLDAKFGGGIDVEGIIFLIGVQELGKGKIKLGKSQKLEVMHIAICTILAPYGYYEYEGMDADGWPHWRVVNKLPHLSKKEQELLMQNAILDYFENKELEN